MKKIVLIFIVSLICPALAAAQSVFLLKDASKTYDVRVTVAECGDETCEGAGRLELLTKDGKPFQSIRMTNLFLELGADRRPTANLIELYGMNNSGIVFEDYDFDGRDDLAVRNGNDGSYGGPSYDVFLASRATGKFIRNPALTRLASENLGLFTVDKKAKTIETFAKSGCCWHETTRWRVTGGRPSKVYVFTEDAAGADGVWMMLTTRTLVGGRWRTKTRRVKIADYYKEN